MSTMTEGLALIERQRQEREVTRSLQHVQRGPCGGWHWIHDRKHYCRACIALGSLPSHTVRIDEGARHG